MPYIVEVTDTHGRIWLSQQCGDYGGAIFVSAEKLGAEAHAWLWYTGRPEIAAVVVREWHGVTDEQRARFFQRVDAAVLAAKARIAALRVP